MTFTASDPLGAVRTMSSFFRVVAILRGDVDNNAKYSVNDLTVLMAYFFRGGPPPQTPESADVNADARLDISDVTYLINYLYLNGPKPPE